MYTDSRKNTCPHYTCKPVERCPSVKTLPEFHSPSKKVKTSTRPARIQPKIPIADTEKWFLGCRNIFQVDTKQNCTAGNQSPADPFNNCNVQKLIYQLFHIHQILAGVTKESARK